MQKYTRRITRACKVYTRVFKEYTRIVPIHTQEIQGNVQMGEKHKQDEIHVKVFILIKHTSEF